MASDSPNRPRDDGRMFAGKRRGRRKGRSLEISLVDGLGGSYAARTVNLSRTGALVEVTEPSFQKFSDYDDLVAFKERVEDRFGRGLRVIIGGGVVELRGRVVRVEKPAVGDWRPRIGIDFVQPISDANCQSLGIEAVADSPPAPIEDLPARERAKR
jgi:hypothetical protein